MIQCKLCGSTSFKPIYVDPAIEKCAKCELVRTKKTPHPNYRSYHRDVDYENNEKLFRNIFLKRYKLIAGFTNKKGKVLEIGCSTGVFLEIFKQNSWDVVGIEPSQSGKVAEAKGIKVIKNSFEKVKFKSKFDLIILNHTLEHVEDPVFVLTKAQKLLSEDGLLFVDVPNFDSFSSRLWGKRWKYLLPEEHVHHFTSWSLIKALEGSGLKPIYINTWTGVFDVDNPLQKIVTQITSGKPYLYKSFILDMLNLPFDILSTKIFHLGTNLVVIAKKP